MEEINVRDFKSRLSHYLDLIAQGEVFIVRGIKIGRRDDLGESVTTSVTTLSDEEISRVAERFADIIHRKQSLNKIYAKGPAFPSTISSRQEISRVVEKLDDFEEVVQCEKCGKVATHSMWEEGEERFVCEGCVRKQYGKMAKGVLARMNKL